MRTHLKTRRIFALGFTAVALFVVWAIAWLQETSLGHSSYLTGFSTLAALLILFLLGVRRRLPVLPLGSAATWTQIHIYTGIFATGAFVMHVPNIVAGGVFEFALSMLFWVVAVSGFYGVYISRTLPKRLTAIEGERRFDRVSWHRRQIAETAKRLVNETADTSANAVLSQFYQEYLAPFFGQRPSLAYVLIPTGRRRRQILGDLTELNRYLEGSSRETTGRIAALVRRRDDLDYQYALQMRLRMWLIVHAAFSVMLTAGAIIHGILALRFTM